MKRLLGDAGIVRHRGKIEAAIANARGVLELREAGTPLHELVWSYAPESYGAPQTTADWHAQTDESKALSKRLKAAASASSGRQRCGPAMQACGIVNDHLATCWVRDDVQREIDAARPPERRSGLEQSLQPLEVPPELLLRTPRHDPCREAGQQSRVADARDGEARPVVVRLELVAHDERHGAVERAQREQRAARRTP